MSERQANIGVQPLQAVPSPGRGILQRQCACGQHTPGGGECDSCRRNGQTGVLQRARTRTGRTSTEPPAAPPIVQDVLRSPGRPLDEATRSFMEPRFGRDFSSLSTLSPGLQTARLAVGPEEDAFERQAQVSARRILDNDRSDTNPAPGVDFSRVRVHTGPQAAAAARSVNAQAFTVGQHMVFAEGMYRPESSSGKRLLAHELTHVVQQSSLSPISPLVQRAMTRGAGGCAPMDQVDEDDNGARGAGETAHIQIQSFLLPAILNELQIPRATKTQKSSPGCQPESVEDGFADLWRRSNVYLDLAEIKSIGAVRPHGVDDVEHYIRRSEQSMDRIFGSGGSCAQSPEGVDDTAFANRIGMRNARRTPRKMTGLLTGDTVIGPFDGDRARTLKARLVEPGAVGYWCTGGSSDTYSCGVSQQETRNYIDRVALVPAQNLVDRLIQERVERPLDNVLERQSTREMLMTGERFFGAQVRRELAPYLGPAGSSLISQANAERLGEVIDQEAGPIARVIVVTVLRRLRSHLVNTLRTALRNVLADAIQRSLVALCVLSPAIAIAHLLNQLEQELRRQARLLIPVVAATVATLLATDLLAFFQEVIVEMISAIGRGLSAIGRFLLEVGEILLRVLAVVAILVLAVGVIVLAILTVLTALDPVPGDEVALGAATLFLARLIPALGGFVARGFA